MKSSTSSLQPLLTTVERVQRICAPYVGSIDCLAVSGLQPSLTLPNDEEILPQSACTALQQNVRSAILDVARRRLQIIRQSAFTSYTSALRNTAPLQHLGGCSDAQAEKLLCETFEGEFDRCIKRLVAYTREAVKRRSGEGDGGQGKKSNGFGPYATSILEAAFAHKTDLTTAECSIVAKKAGITYQQVRTWFQNRRNRKKSGERRTASHSEVQARATESVIPPERRVISALPKRAAPSTNLGPPPPHSTRPTRGLPRRAQHVSPSPTPSVSSASSLESILPSGGFTAPVYPSFPLAQPSEIAYSTLAIPYTGAETPAFNFTPPTPLNADFNFDADMNFNIDDILPPWSTADFTSLLNSVLAEPTLAGSPTFTTPPSTNPPDEVEEPRFGGMEGWPQDGLGDDFLAMLNGFVDYPASSDNADSSLASSPMSVQSSDFTSTGPRSIEASPLDLLEPAPTSADPCSTSLPASPSSMRSSSESLISPIHPRILSRSTSEPIVASYTADAPVDPSAWMSGVLAFDCVGGEWEGYEEKIQLGGEWDFSGILGMQAEVACS